jgi:selenocysteine-specific elongation factor
VHVLATAGHVDHGKSTLVRALTGMEPDRWAEERRRGMTIDLGYAWLTLPGGAELAFVDVPGHQRFIGNMLAGLGPAPAVLFVVAADEGWCRQSAEHLAAADALGITHGVLAVTRSDLADPGPALADARARLARSALGTVDAVAVSGRTGAGLPELCDALARLADRLPEPDTVTPTRLWVDRVFTVRGSGTVVTGTLGSGRVALGDQLELHGRAVTVRGIQCLGAAREQVGAPARVALNLRGVARDTVQRGDALVAPGAWYPAHTIDARLRSRDRLSEQLMLHVGSAALPVRLRRLGGCDDAPVVRIQLPRPLPLRAGDRGVLRDPGLQKVAAGLLVLDADPPALHRRGAAAARAAELADATGTLDATREIARRGAMRRDHLEALGGRVPVAAREIDGWLVDDGACRRWVAAAEPAVQAWAVRNPLEPAMPTGALRRALGLPADALASAVAREAGLTVRGGRVQPRVRAGSLGPAEPAIRQVEQRLSADPFAAPEAYELQALGLGRRELAAAERAGRLLRVGADIVLLPSAPAEAVHRLATLPQPFTVSEARAALGTTRRVAIPLLEHLDAGGHTQRVDATRRVVAT